MDLATTRDNQMDAIQELIRVTKLGGLIIIEEQVNYSWTATIIFYYASKLAMKLNIRIDKMQITPNTVVGDLTLKKLQWMCEGICLIVLGSKMTMRSGICHGTCT